MIVTSNKPFLAWGEIFGDQVVAEAMIDRLVHHAEILALTGDSYRLKDKDLGQAEPQGAAGRRLSARPTCCASPYGLSCAGGSFLPSEGGQFSTGLDNRARGRRRETLGER